MPFFETSVQEIKYKVLKKIAELAYADQLTPENTVDIAEEIIPEGKPTMRCCIYKERAIINQRVSAAIGGGGHSKRNVRVLPIACDECPIEGIQVTHSCRGCIAHYCMNTCPKDAISIVNLRAQIEKLNGYTFTDGAHHGSLTNLETISFSTIGGMYLREENIYCGQEYNLNDFVTFFSHGDEVTDGTRLHLTWQIGQPSVPGFELDTLTGVFTPDFASSRSKIPCFT